MSNPTRIDEHHLRVNMWASAFRDAVEGRPGPLSVELTDTSGILRAEPISEKSKTRPDLIVSLLRSQIPLSPLLRSMIADMIDPSATSAFCFKNFGRRKRGRHPPWGQWHMDAAKHVADHHKERGTYESAVVGAMKQFSLSRSQVTDAYRRLVKARKDLHESERLERCRSG